MRTLKLLVQDERRQKLYFIDIEKCKIYTYDPASGVHGYQIFDRRPTALALLEDDSGVRQSPEKVERVSANLATASGVFRRWAWIRVV